MAVSKHLIFSIVEGRVPFQTPRILATGELETWPYMILSHVSGVRIGDLWPKLNARNKARLACQMAEITKQLQCLEPSPIISGRVKWNDFITERFNDTLKNHAATGLQSGEMRKLEKFIDNFDVSSFMTENSVYIHSDLTADHFLVDEIKCDITGVIDFADSMSGHPEYDPIAYFCYLLKADSTSQEAFYKAWGSRISPDRMLMWIILHRFSNLKRYFGEDHLSRVGNFEQLATELFIK